MLKRLFPLLLLTCAAVLLLCPAVSAEENSRQVVLDASSTGFDDPYFLTDDDLTVFYSQWKSCTVELTSDTPFCSLYLIFNNEYRSYTVTDNLTGETVTAGQHRFLHEFVRLPAETTSVTVSFPGGPLSISEIRAYTAGTPTDVQIWEPPLEGNTDLLLMSTHGDDEHLFFAGLLPIYAGELDYNVQVVYLTNHREWTYVRCHEMLNGLWAVGVRAYPMFGTFPDFRIDNRDDTYAYYEELGVTKEDLLAYVVEQIRRFDPQVVVAHDFKGEYGHGMHQVYADLVSQAIYLTNNPSYFPRSAEKYGLWDVPKTYFHVYGKNSIELELDDPLESFDGLSAFDVSRYIGFPCHETQVIYREFTDWIYGAENEVTCSTDITRFSPRYYGLYRSTVGEDVEKNDVMENTPRYLERKRQEEEKRAQEEAARLEAERLAQEEAERAAREEAERLAKEEAARKEEEAKRLEEKRLKEEAEAKRKEQQQLTLFLIVIGVVLLLIAIGALLPRMLRKKETHIKAAEEASGPSEEAEDNKATGETETAEAIDDPTPSEDGEP